MMEIIIDIVDIADESSILYIMFLCIILIKYGKCIHLLMGKNNQNKFNKQLKITGYSIVTGY